MNATILAAMLYAVTPTPAPTNTPTAAVFSQADQAESKEALKVVAQAFGIEPEKPKADEKQPEQKKTVADVADKALDLTAKFVSVVAGKVEQAAPTVMRIMVRQQYAKALGDVIGPLLFFVLVVCVTTFVRRVVWKKPEDEDCDEYAVHILITAVLPAVLCTAIAGVFAYRMADAVQYVVNPEYYAIKDLLQMLLRPGSV